MSTRSHQPPHLMNEFGEPLSPLDAPLPPEEKCAGLKRFVKGLCGFLLSHVGLLTLVVGYCMLGAVVFEKLEAENEERVKRHMISERVKVTDDLWDITSSVDLLIESEWTENVTSRLKQFEHRLLKAMKEEGWDGVEGGKPVNWTFTGALFYAITVITTIGYGHIAPKTAAAKIVTIFYAILGIPLTVLCWSNIGDAMANAFRFTYWRICCYLCTRKPRRRRRHHSRHSRVLSVRGGVPVSPSLSSPPTAATTVTTTPGWPLRRSMRASARSDDTARSDSTNVEDNNNAEASRYYDDGDAMLGNHHAAPHFVGGGGVSPVVGVGGGSLARGKRDSESETNILAGSGPVAETNNNKDIEKKEKKSSTAARMMARGLGLKRGDGRESQKSGKSVASNAASTAASEDGENTNAITTAPNGGASPPAPGFPVQGRSGSSFRQPAPPSHLRLQRVPEDDWAPPPSAAPPPPPGGLSPGGPGVPPPVFYYDDYASDDDLADDYSRRNVPIWLSLLLVVAYIVWGAFIFKEWEDWKLLDSGYFCFITLTTIGFGDLVPNQQTPDGELRIALCSLYLLFGIAMIAMSFNLVQEQVIANVKELGRQLGILKDEDEDEDY